VPFDRAANWKQQNRKLRSLARTRAHAYEQRGTRDSFAPAPSEAERRPAQRPDHFPRSGEANAACRRHTTSASGYEQLRDLPDIILASGKRRRTKVVREGRRGLRIVCRRRATLHGRVCALVDGHYPAKLAENVRALRIAAGKSAMPGTMGGNSRIGSPIGDSMPGLFGAHGAGTVRAHSTEHGVRARAKSASAGIVRHWRLARTDLLVSGHPHRRMAAREPAKRGGMSALDSSNSRVGKQSVVAGDRPLRAVPRVRATHQGRPPRL
jgi:hypothetical protein